MDAQHAEFRLTHLHPDDAAAVRDLSDVASFAAGSSMMAPGDPERLVLICLEGYAKVVDDHAGQPVVLGVLGPGELLGEIALLDRGDHTAEVVALTDVRAYRADAVGFMALLERRPHLRDAIVSTVTSRLRRTSALRSEQLAIPAILRVAGRLVHLATTYGAADGPTTVVPLPLTRADLASWSGVSRDAGNRAVRQLTDAGWIELAPDRLLLRDVLALRRFVGLANAAGPLK